MAVVTVSLTSESLHHLMRILDEAIDPAARDLLQPAFRQLTTILHHMVAGCTVAGFNAPPYSPANPPSITLTAPTPAQTAIVNELDTMLQECATAITNTNNVVNYDLVLRV